MKFRDAMIVGYSVAVIGIASTFGYSFSRKYFEDIGRTEFWDRVDGRMDRAMEDLFYGPASSVSSRGEITSGSLERK